ncbi:MAG: DUF3185 domain-containing protein [Desulfobacterales bacterium]|nr:DUF3185 domain-containing protein [Desulfobacterales bacterium]
MRTNIILTTIMLAIGIVACGYLGVAYTNRGNVVEAGPLVMMIEKTSTLALPSIAGSIAFVGGIVLLVMGRKKG